MLITLLKSYFFTKLRTFKSRQHLERWQNRKVIKHLSLVIRHSSFYKELYKGKNLDDWKEFPIIEKKDMMKHFDSLNTCNISLKDSFKIAVDAEEKIITDSTLKGITIGLSTGTSGNRGIFLVNSKERFSWAGSILAKTLPSFITTPQNIAFFFRTTSPLYNSIKSMLIKFEYYDIQDCQEKHLYNLKRQQPTILVAPPSMLRNLAKMTSDGILNIKPTKIISIAEVLDPIDEAYISNVFDQKIHQIYQATEGFLATTCKYGTMHLNEDLLVIQKEMITGSENKFYPIVTDFNRFSQPVIRYRLNDILEESKEICPCGSKFTSIKHIEGRSDDIFYFQSSTEIKSIFPDFIRKSVITADPHIEEYFITQTSLNKIEIAIKATSNHIITIQAAIKQKFDTLFQKHNIIAPEIIFIPYCNHPPQKKLRRVQRTFELSS